ncbi:hypothetical protein D3C80_1267620 [compost metagenome]
MGTSAAVAPGVALSLSPPAPPGDAVALGQAHQAHRSPYFPMGRDVRHGGGGVGGLGQRCYDHGEPVFRH